MGVGPRSNPRRAVGSGAKAGVLSTRKAMSGSSPFTDPESVARYLEGPVRLVPGFHGLYRMTGILLAERIGDDAQVRVIGAGGGLELKPSPTRSPDGAFCGVDPSAGTLGLA
jgi:tRNA (cmo5U34)-methyltransferase